MKLSEAIEEFLIACEADGLAHATLIWHTSLLKKFMTWAGSETELESIEAKMIREFLVYIRKHYKEHTVSGQNRSLHRFFKWVSNEYQTDNPMRNIKYIQPPAPTELRAASTSDIVKLFDAIGDGIWGVRDRAMISFGCDTGSRVGGIVNLNIHSLDIDNLRAIVTEKGRKSRAVYFSPFTGRLIQKWINMRDAHHDSVFYNLYTGDALTSSGAQQMIRRLKDRAGITGRMHWHALRHTFSKEYLRNGGDIATLSRMLGHADIKLTMKFYLWFAVEEMAAEHKIFPMTDIIQDQQL
jgi:site-specific recombinase XerD